ncbi:MAG TPA: DNA polymerase III subunit delta [Solirubrobacteraceae bacterium]|nr:DNA polymerase III subunit delta [Solirubrobacteraceae bacterium]
MPTFKPAYLIHGDDHGRIAERRARLRALAEKESGSGGVEVLEGDAATPEQAAAALQAMTFALGRRFVIVEGVERWKPGDLEPLAHALADPPPDTTIALFAREESRAKAPDGLHEIVKKAGGDVAAEQTVRAWELPKWVAAQGRELGLDFDRGAASALVRHVGDRQQRLVRELEKMELELGRGARVTERTIEDLAATSAERKVWTLGDAVVGGDDALAQRCLLELRAQGERLPGLIYNIANRLRQANEIATRLDAGESPAQVRKGLRMPSKAAERLIADVQRRDVYGLRAALAALADLERDSRGGGALSEDTAAVLAVSAATRD